jgi:hypothetical protein
VFYLSAIIIAMAVVRLTLVRRLDLAILILYSAAIYLGMVFIVAMKQGGESRYTDIVEPAYVLATAIACASLMQGLVDCALLFVSGRYRRYSNQGEH